MNPTRAKQLCELAHKGQFRRDGTTPYHTHPFAVADLLNTDEEKILAYLHDVVEDTEYQLSDSWWKNLVTPECDVIKIPDHLWHDLQLLTKQPDQTYYAYIQTIADSGRLPVIKCKLVDMFHNMQTASPKQLAKYNKHLPLLLAAI